MEHTQCWHACWNQTIIVAKNKIQYLNFRYPVHQSLSEKMWLERLQTADCQEEMFDAFATAGTQSTLFRSGTEKLPEDCGTWQNIQHLHIQKKNLEWMPQLTSTMSKKFTFTNERELVNCP